MKRFSEKVYLSLTMPTDDNSIGDQQRIRLALAQLGYENVHFSLAVLRQLYPACRNSNFDITVSLAYRQQDWVVTGIEPGDCTGSHYGLAVDYGSTTIVMELVDMISGKVIDRVSQVNGQTAYGTDILTRITYAMEKAEHKAALQKATVETFDSLLEQLSERNGIDAFHCPAMILSGNTTMIHFLLGLDAWTVFASPYAPVSSDPGWFWGTELGMAFSGMVYIIPAASNYVGGDIVSGLIKLDIHKKEETCLFFDIGTNGELVIGNRNWIAAGAGAAGPALEGYISRYGMRAQPGAIDKVSIRGEELKFTTIDNQKPIGICGSGIIDLLAQMRLNGWIDIAGDLNPAASSRIRWFAQEEQYGAVYATEEESAAGEPLYFSQTDIRQYLDTKAAAYTMVECLLEAVAAGRKIWLCAIFPVHFPPIRIWNLPLPSAFFRIFPVRSIAALPIPLWRAPGFCC